MGRCRGWINTPQLDKELLEKETGSGAEGERDVGKNRPADGHVKWRGEERGRLRLGSQRAAFTMMRIVRRNRRRAREKKPSINKKKKDRRPSVGMKRLILRESWGKKQGKSNPNGTKSEKKKDSQLDGAGGREAEATLLRSGVE